jgi:hypothetical protein
MPTALETILGDVEKALHYNSSVLAAVYNRIQEQEAEKVPGDWKPYRIIVGALDTVQVLQGNPKRSSVAIKNDGAAVVLIGPAYFEPTSATEDFNLAAYGSVGNYYPIAVGESVTLNTTGPIYAYCIGYTTGGTTFATVRAVESLFSTSSSRHKGRGRIHEEGEMGFIDKGITSPWSAEQLTGLK